MEQVSVQGFENWLLVARGVGMVAAFAAFAWALLRMRRESREQFESVRAGQRELAAQTHALSERVVALATLLASLPRRAEPLSEEPRVAAPRRETGVRSYETAKRLARSGASVEEIVASCGVAGTEARLLRRLHGADSRRGHAT